MAHLNGTATDGPPVNGTHVDRTLLNSSHPTGIVLNGQPPAESHTDGQRQSGAHLQARSDFDQARLEREIAVAKARAAGARLRASTRDTEVREALRAELARSRDELTQLEDEFAAAIARVQRDADARVAQVLDEARRRVAEGKRSADDRATEAFRGE